MEEELIFCLSELEKLKTVERGLKVGKRKESSAEHSWGCMLIADILLDFVDEPLNKQEILEYLLYHDVVEIYAGDAKFNNPEEMKIKHEKERTAYLKILDFVPNKGRFEQIMASYEKRTSREAQFAKAVDCLEACVRNLNQDGPSFMDGFTPELIRGKYLPHVAQFEITLKLFESLMERIENKQ